MSAIEQTWSIIAGEYPFVMRAISSRRASSVELGIVRDLVEVQVEDVLAVFLRRCAEGDVTTHAARTRERGIEVLERHVRRADEVDLRAGRTRRGQPQADVAHAAGHDVDRVEERIDLVRPQPAHERRVVDAVHRHEQLVEGEAAAHAAHHPGEDALVDVFAIRVIQPGYGERGSGAR